MTSLSYFPVVQEEAQLVDLLSRAAWFLSFCPIDRIYVPIATGRLKGIEWRVAPGMDVSIAKNFDVLRRKVVFIITETESDLDACMTEASIILRWKKNSVPGFVSAKTLAAWEKGKKVLQVDPIAIRQEGSFYIEVGLHLLANKQQLIDENKTKFDKLVARLGKFDQAYLMATGPSVENYKKFDFTNALSIVCNSVILDEELMLRVRPQILVFADPIFHFGPSLYAGSFRKTLVESAKRHDFTICMPFKYYGLFIAAIPELAHRTIAIPFTKDRDWNFSLDKDFNLKTTANILTFLMIPLAGTFAKEIGIIGCDGRPLEKNDYFWGHNEKTQINDKMANIREVHPGFFAIDYNDYYLEHCETLSQQLIAGERVGKKILSLGFSHIPALRSRFGRGKRISDRTSKDTTTTVFFIDPDGADWSGHYMAYNEKVVEAFSSEGAKVQIVCRKNLAENITNSRPHYQPVLTAHSWEIGHRRDNHEYAAAFERELFPLVASEISLGRSVLIYMYFGSVEHASILSKLCAQYPDVRVNVNMHYTSYRIGAKWWVDAWRPWFQWLDIATPRFVVTLPTHQLQRDLADVTGCIFDVAPHPSTGISDMDFIQFRRPIDQVSEMTSLRVLFPSAPRVEKGYEAGVECARRLAKVPKIRSTIRHAPTGATPAELAKPLENMPGNVEVVTGALSNDDFVHMFRTSDIVVLPYTVKDFGKRTSGLLIDAIYCGVPCVVVEGTWLARVVELYGCGVVVPDSTPEALLNGVLKLQGKYHHFVKNAREAAIDYFAKNSWKALARSVLSFKETVADERAGSKLLVIDLTPVGGLSATGRIKEAFFRGWPESTLQVVSLNATQRKMCVSDIHGRTTLPASSDDAVIAHLRMFNPDVVYYRAVDNETVHAFAERVISEFDKPLLVHLMDDWPARLQFKDVSKFERYDRSLRAMLKAACACLSIGDDMSTAFEKRYGIPFRSLANAVDPAAFPPRQRKRQRGEDFVIRYTGALADDMTFQSVIDFAMAVEALSSDLGVRLDIYTRAPWLSIATRTFGEYKSVCVLEQVESSAYYPLLQDADALLIAYNFDAASRQYVGMSVANKLPEYLASGTQIIAYGPDDASTVRQLSAYSAAVVISEKSHTILVQELKEIVLDEGRANAMGSVARLAAFQRHNVWNIAQQFFSIVALASRAGPGTRPNEIIPEVLYGSFSREDNAHWDETMGVAQLFRDKLIGSTMIDVGAHHGSALMPFLNQGWKVFAFEPDEKNRAKLLQSLAKQANRELVNINTSCVSNESRKGVSFYRSEQSTGISGLSAFHESHVEAQRVDVTTLTEFFQDKDLPPVDFLKIDTEGHDLFVLQGFPWARAKPAVIECEFEDTKTVPLGYTFHDLAQFLVTKGYTVYVSEWHPIIRYGIRHDWNRLTRYPCKLADLAGWGNLLAFRDSIDESDLVAAVKRVLSFGVTGGKPCGTAQTAKTAPVAAKKSTQTELVGTRRSGFRVEPGPCFAQMAPKLWRYTQSDAPQKIWVATVNVSGQTKGTGFVGGLSLQAGQAMTVNVSLARHGKTQYEGTTKRLTLEPGAAKTIKLSKEFICDHSALRLQVEVLELKSGDSALLTIDDLYLTESLASIRQRFGEADMTLREANRRFRDGDLGTAMGMYLLLGEQQPLKMYSDNALMAARKLGMAPVRSTDELLQWVRG
jgi:FkbM family methyltransferase